MGRKKTADPNGHGAHGQSGTIWRLESQASKLLAEADGTVRDQHKAAREAEKVDTSEVIAILRARNERFAHVARKPVDPAVLANADERERRQAQARKYSAAANRPADSAVRRARPPMSRANTGDKLGASAVGNATIARHAELGHATRKPKTVRRPKAARKPLSK